MAISVSGNVMQRSFNERQLVDGDLKEVGMSDDLPAENLILKRFPESSTRTNPACNGCCPTNYTGRPYVECSVHATEIGWHYVGLRNDVTGNQENINVWKGLFYFG